MILIDRAKAHEYPQIRDLLAGTGMSSDSSLLNRKDIALVALYGGRVIGFLWIGLMAKGRVGYIDKFTVSKTHSKKGVGNALAIAALQECKKRGVKEVHGFIRQGGYHEASCMNALKMALGADEQSYTYVRGQIAFIESELKTLSRSIA